MKAMLGKLIVLTLAVLAGSSMATVQAAGHQFQRYQAFHQQSSAPSPLQQRSSGPSPLPGCTVAEVESDAGQVPNANGVVCDPQGPETGYGDDVDAADCDVEGECQGTATDNPEGEGAYDAGGDDALPDHG